MAQPPPAEGVRLTWSDIPARIRTQIEHRLASPITSVSSQPTGFSPGLAARLRLEDGRHVFVKAVGPELNPDTPAMHRREGHIVAALPADAPVPRLLWSYDEGEAGWIVLAFEDIEGWHPAQPWIDGDLNRVLEAMAQLSDSLTPSPLEPPLVDSISPMFARHICGWQFLLSDPSYSGKLDDWSIRHLEALAEIEAKAPDAVVGNTLLHFDVRADNILLTPDQVWFVDWPGACIGAAWVDLVAFAPSVTMQGGPPPEALIARHPAVQNADPNALTAAVVAIAGYFTYKGLQPPPPGLPTLRAFQATQGVVARNWIAQRTGWT